MINIFGSRLLRKYAPFKPIRLYMHASFRNRVKYHSLMSFCTKQNKIIYVPLDKLEHNFSRSSGPGGQNVNKLNTKVELRFKVSEADWLEEDVKNRLRCNSNFVNANDEMIVVSSVYRTQEQNLQDAHDKITERINLHALPPKEKVAFTYEEDEETRKARIQIKRQKSQLKDKRSNNKIPKNDKLF